MDFTALKTAIQNAVKLNGNEEITGDILQGVLLSMVTTLGDSAINDLVSALANEVTNRQNADGTLQTNITNEAAARGNADTALGTRIDNEVTARENADTALSNRITAITDAIDNGYVYAGIATTSTEPATGKVFYLTTATGVFTNFGGITVNTKGIKILKKVGSTWMSDTVIVMDDTPTENSTNLVKSGGVYASIASVLSKIAEGYLYVGIATAATNPSTPTTKVFYIAVAAGTYTNFLDSGSAALVLTQGINILKYNGTAWSVEQVWGVDDNPTAGSNKLVKSGGVFNDIMTNGSAFDLSAYNNGTTYADLNAALTALNALPADYKKGGMSVKYVQSSDNNYVQFRYMGTDVTGNPNPFLDTANWQGVDDEPTAGSDNLVKSGGVFSEVNGEIQSDTRTWTNVQNQEISYDFSAGDMLLIQLLADSDFFINIVFHTSSGYKTVGRLSKQNDIVATKVPNDLIEYVIFYNHSEQGTVTGTINLCIIEDVTKLPYRFYKLFEDISYIKPVVQELQENVSDILPRVTNIENKSFIKSYQTITNSEQKALVDYIEDLELSVAEELADKEFYIRILGVYQGIFYMRIWVRGENINAAFETPVSSLPVDTNYAFEVHSEKIKGYVVINTKNISSMGYMNNSDSQIVLNVNNYFLTEKQQFKPNLFVLDGAADGKYMDNDGIIRELSNYIMSNYLPVQPNKTYKCSVGIPFINFFNGSKTRTRGLTQYDSPTTFKTGSNEYFVVVSLVIHTFLQKEMVIIQEVTDESDEIDASNVGMSADEKISDGNYSLAKINGYYSGQFKLGNALQNSNFISLSVNDGDKLIATSIVGSYAGKITHLHFYCSCESNFNLTLGIGNIDQRNWGLISRTFVVEVVNGENNIDISQTIEENERLFVIANSASTSANAKLYTGDTGIHSESQDGDITMSPVSGYVAIEYSISGNRLLSDSQLATLTQLSEVSATLNDKIQDINLGNLFIQSPDNKYFRLTISNEGILTPVVVPVQGDILIMGNSYDVVGITSGVWWGDFGMAASRKENDWKHQLLTKLRKNDNLIYSFTKQVLADWETTWNKTDDTVEDIFNYNDTTLPALAGTPNYSMVIIRIGENSTDTNYERVQLRMKNLLQYIRTKVGNDVPIILGGCVKIRTEQNPSFIAAANEVSGVTYVDMTPAGLIVPFTAGLDYKVLGDDGVWHTISESSQASAVAGHPNDMVFTKMAELFYPVVLEKLI